MFCNNMAFKRHGSLERPESIMHVSARVDASANLPETLRRPSGADMEVDAVQVGKAIASPLHPVKGIFNFKLVISLLLPHNT